MTDVALEWMSYRRLGNVHDVSRELTGRDATRRFVDGLVALGHAEWTAFSSWRVAPPVLAGLPREGEAAAVLCGARTPKLQHALSVACAAAGAGLETQELPGQPSTIVVTAPTGDALAEVALQVGIPLQREAAFGILACTPSVREWPRAPFQMVQGRVGAVRRFSRSRMHWVASSLAEASGASTGLFRIQRDWDWVSLIKSSITESAAIDDRAGRIAVAAKSKVVRWSADGGTLSLPAQLYPPTTMVRGLVLCSGALPTFDRETRQIVFHGITAEHLRLFLALTQLRLA